jgi:hypothetical protein
MVLVNQEKNLDKWNDAINLLYKLTKPEGLEGEDYNKNLYLSEDDIV